MIFVYIFTAGLLGVIILLIISAREQKKRGIVQLQNERYWYNIDVVARYADLHTYFHRVSRPILRNTLHKLLEIYLRVVNKLRRVLRKHIGSLLDHYAKEHDQLYHGQPSQFITEIQEHKNQTDQKKDVTGLDEYSQ